MNGGARQAILTFSHSHILTFFLVLCLSAAYSQSPTELYNSSNASYKAAQYEQAAAGYEKVLTQGYKSPVVYYNLGNCYY